MKQKTKPPRPPSQQELLQALLDVTTAGFAQVADGFAQVMSQLLVIVATLGEIADALPVEPPPQHPPMPGGFAFHVLGGIPRPQEGISMPQEGTCSVTEAFRFQVKPNTPTGKPAQIQAGSLTVTPDEAGENVALAQAKVENDSTFLVAANLVDGATNGSTTFTVRGDADLGSGVVELVDQVKLNVTSELATNLGVTPVGAVSRDSAAMPKA